MKRFYSRASMLGASLACALLMLPVGCGSGGTGPAGSYGPPPPKAYGNDAYRPNYGGDLTGSLFWEEPVVRYRILDTDAARIAEDPARAKATDIRGVSLPHVGPSDSQRDAIRDAFSKWNRALSGERLDGDPSQEDDPGGVMLVPYAARRVFVEAPPGEAAQIDVVVQTPADFRAKTTNFTETLGETTYYVKDIDAGKIGRAVIRVRGDLDRRQFAYTLLHEKGHAGGFYGHDRRFLKLMYPIQSPVTPLVELDRYDVNTYRALYVGRSTEAAPTRSRSGPIRAAYFD